MQQMRKLNCMSSLILILFILTSQASQVVGDVYTVDGHQIEVRLVPDKSTMMLGEPINLSFIVQNHSDQDLQVLVGGDYRNALGRPNSFTVTVAREDGKRVPQPDAGPGFGGLFGPNKIPAQGNYVFKLFLPHWATFEEVGRYTIVAKRTLQLSKYATGRENAEEQATEVQAQASTTIEVVPQDTELMGELISGLGTTMLSRHNTAEAAASTLSYIPDERVIPYFVKSLETNNYNLKVSALRALSKFNDEAAFQALKRGMETKRENIGNVTTKEVANQLVENIRNTAAGALAKSPHPGAIPFLLSMRNDTSEGVRITVLHVLGKMKPEEAIPILLEMSHDRSKIVRDEAKRYLNLLSSKE